MSAWKDVNWSLCEKILEPTKSGTSNENGEGILGQAVVPVESDQFSFETSWKDVDWDVARAAVAELIAKHEEDPVSLDEKDVLEDSARGKWEKFYKHNKTNFFKDRNYLQIEFPELLSPSLPNYAEFSSRNKSARGKRPLSDNAVETNAMMPADVGTEDIPFEPEKVVLEAGCGVGNTLFPLLQYNPRNFYNVFDFSEHAIELLKSNPRYDPTRALAFVCDITSEQLPTKLQTCSVDIVMMIFFLSAVSPERMDKVLSRLFQALKPGGIVIFRDYGLYDMTQLRFINKRKRKLGENFYMRGDGTRTYFFSLEKTKSLFESAGFVVDQLVYDTREIRNRKRLLAMYRVWIKAKFRKPLLDG